MEELEEALEAANVAVPVRSSQQSSLRVTSNEITVQSLGEEDAPRFKSRTRSPA